MPSLIPSDFVAWLEECDPKRTFRRWSPSACPIACYLRDTGIAPNPSVTPYYYRLNGDEPGSPEIDMPAVFADFIVAFDNDIDEPKGTLPAVKAAWDKVSLTSDPA